MTDITPLTVFASSGERNTDGLTLANGFPASQKPKRQWFNWLLNSVTAKVNELVTAVNALVTAVNAPKYAIDDVFMTFRTFADSAAVAAALGYGTWARVPAGYITSAGAIVDGNGVSATFTAGATSGENAHEISEGEMPEHVHRMSIRGTPSGLEPPVADQFNLSTPFSTPTFTSVLDQDNAAALTDNYTLRPTNWASAGASAPMPLRPINTAMNFWRRTA